MSQAKLLGILGTAAVGALVVLSGCGAVAPSTSSAGRLALFQGLSAGPMSPTLFVASPAVDVTPSAPDLTCPDGMVLIEGEYCTDLVQTCLQWMNDAAPFDHYRCAEYSKTPTCRGKKVQKRFCIDKYEHVEQATDLPLNNQAWIDAKRVCETEGKRVCWESEWNMACEGKETRPYAYGWKRDKDACNIDNFDLFPPNNHGKLLDLRTPASRHPACVTSEGVHGMAGNVAEWVAVDGSVNGSVVYQKGNWWQPGKHSCRDAQAGHDKYYKGAETGFRCCKDAE